MAEFTEKIIEWYGRNKRDLPWRDSSDPYLIWVSEIILQQTRVAQGHAYYLRFVRRFPDVASLAEASEDEVMKYWEGLGYYSRARHLHEAARSMQGRFPTTYEGVLALKGVGRYTAAAICSFAYGMAYAVVDGNVYRVLARYFGVEVPVDSGKGQRLFAALADEVLDRERPGLYNQAIMDFGALQCTPQSPRCESCPLAGSCAARAAGTVAQLPVKAHRVKVTHRYLNYIYVRAGAYTYIRKRTGSDIWRNLFEFPVVETPQAVAYAEFLALPQVKALAGLSPQAVVRQLCAERRHVLSHQVIHASLYELSLSGEAAPPEGFLRVEAASLGAYAFPRLLNGFLEEYLQAKEI